MFIYTVEMFIKDEWTEEVRHYERPKRLDEFDLHDIPGKRRNAKFHSIRGTNFVTDYAEDTGRVS
jgi:hypothetical protein